MEINSDYNIKLEMPTLNESFSVNENVNKATQCPRIDE